MQKIVYKDKLRDVVVISKASDNYFMFDLSEYEEEEKEYFETEYRKLHEDFLSKVKELGISSNYRYFNKNGITWIKDET